MPVGFPHRSFYRDPAGSPALRLLWNHCQISDDHSGSLWCQYGLWHGQPQHSSWPSKSWLLLPAPDNFTLSDFQCSSSLCSCICAMTSILTTALLSTVVFHGLRRWKWFIGQLHILSAGSPKLMTFHTTCGRFYTGSLSPNTFPLGFPPWSADASWVWRLYWELCCSVSSHSGRSLRYTTHEDLAVPFGRTATMQCRHFPWLAERHGTDFPWRCASSPGYLLSVLSVAQDCSLPPGLGREHLWVEILKGHYINSNWLIETEIASFSKYRDISSEVFQVTW